jgi:hypothetical protein
MWLMMEITIFSHDVMYECPTPHMVESFNLGA